MAYLKTSPPGTGNGAWSSSASYAVGDGVTYTGYDLIPGAGLRFVCIAANSNTVPTLAPGNPAWRLAHPVDSLQLFNAIVACATSPAFAGPGAAWTRAYRLNALGGGLAETSKRFCFTLRNSGTSGQDDAILTLSHRQSSATAPTRFIQVGAATGWIGNTGGQDDQLFRGAWASGAAYAAGDVVSTSSGSYWWVCVLAHTAATSPSASTPQWLQLPNTTVGDLIRQPNSYNGMLHTHWNGGTGNIPLWLFVNKNRIMWVAQSDTRYTLAYAGLLQRFGTREQCPLPLVLTGNTSTTSYAYDSTYLSNAPWKSSDVGHFLTGRGEWKSLSTSYAQIMPYGFLESGLNVAGQYGMEECVFYGVDGGLSGRLDGMAYVSSNGQVSGNELATGSDAYVVFENVYRGQSGGFVALKQS